MGRIITVTANTAFDKIVKPDAAGEHSERSETLLFPAGKGINVARTIATLGREVTALGFVGRAEQQFFNELNSSNFHVHLIPVDGTTRTNISLLDGNGKISAHLKNRGFSITPEHLRELMNRIGEEVSEGDVVVIAGSLPNGVESTAYAELVELCRDLGARVILDSSRQDLRDGLGGIPYMIKPNLEEICALTGASSRPEIVKAAGQILSRGVAVVVISQGAEGVTVVTADQLWKAKVVVDEKRVISDGVGSGDALVGGFAVGLLEQKSLVDTIRLGVACGAANVFMLGPGVCKLDDIDELLPQVEIAKVAETIAEQ
jgi:1-phosphofructokinase family hexose kinase